MILMEFKNNHSKLLHSYNALGDIVYSKVQSFCLPFITKSYKYCNSTWNAQEKMDTRFFE